MKKFIAILMVLLMIPLFSFAAESPTLSKKLVSCEPELEFVLADSTESWTDVLKWMEDVKDDTEGYILYEAVYVNIDQPYEKVIWTFDMPITSEHEPFILIINSEAIVKQEVGVTEEGQVITNFAECEPGWYYICFYIKSAE